MVRNAGGLPGAPYDRISLAYDLLADPAEHQARDRGLDLLDPRPGERVLEIGAGTGRALVALANAVGSSGLVCGLDRSWGMLERARQRTSASSPVHVQLGDGRFLPYLGETFDAAFMSFTLELFDPPDIGRVLSEVKRLLRPGGRLGVVCLSEVLRPGPAAMAYSLLHRMFPHLIDCRPIDILRHLEESGYRPTVKEESTLWRLPVMALCARAVDTTAPSRVNPGVPGAS